MEEEYTVTQSAMPTSLVYELLITDGENTYLVDAHDDIQLSRGRRCTPAKLRFSVLKDDVLSFSEGSIVQFSVNGEIVFKGFVFSKERDKTETIRVTAYDQLRYFKNKDCYVYGGWTAADLLKNICTDYGLTMGTIANTVYKSPEKPQRLEKDKTLTDMILYALDQTLIHTPNHDLYHVYDDGGKIVLKHSDEMKLDIYIDGETLEDFSHTTSIDKDTYDMVKIVREAPDGAAKKLVKTGIVSDKEHIKQWGRLQYLLTPSDKSANAIETAKRILELKNRKTREIRLTNVIGDIRVRGGSWIFVDMNFGDVALKNYVMVDQVEHHFKEGVHLMDLDLFYVEKAGKYEVVYNTDAEVYQQIQEAQQSGIASGSTAGGTTVNGNQVDAAFNAIDGRISPYGGVGCVDNATIAGAYYSPALKEAYDRGIKDVPGLRNFLASKGYQAEAFNGYANKGDLLIYGDDDHVVIADGVGGCFGNSSSAGHAMRYSDANYAWRNGQAPTKIIRMG